jgi:hypothetical protein
MRLAYLLSKTCGVGASQGERAELANTKKHVFALALERHKGLRHAANAGISFGFRVRV